MAKLIQAQPGQTFTLDGKVYTADENGIVKIKDKHLDRLTQFGLKEIKNADDQPEPPTANDDVRKGFSVGSIWHSVVGFFRCAANTAGAAAWDTIQQDQVYLTEEPETPVQQPDPAITIIPVEPEAEAAAKALLAQQAKEAAPPVAQE